MLHSHPHPHARSPPREGERLPGSAATTKPALLLAPHKLGAPQVRPLPPPEFSAAKLLCRTRARATLRASNPPPVPAGKLVGALPPRSGGFRIAISRPGPSRSPRGEAPISFPPVPSTSHPVPSPRDSPPGSTGSQGSGSPIAQAALFQLSLRRAGLQGGVFIRRERKREH